MLFSPLEDKSHIFAPLCNVLYIYIIYNFLNFILILQALSQREYMTNNNNYIYNITNVTGNHNSFRPITVIPKYTST
jgi:hypothetical protein